MSIYRARKAVDAEKRETVGHQTFSVKFKICPGLHILQFLNDEFWYLNLRFLAPKNS